MFPKKILKEMEDAGVNPSVFIPKKLAQFMILLSGSEEETPDLFIEYMLTKLMKKQARLKSDYTPKGVIEKMPALKKLLIEYIRDYVIDFDDFESEEARNKFIEVYAVNYMILATNFSHLLGVDGPDDRTLVFWDWDFDFFDKWGFSGVIEGMVHGVLPDYGLDYTKKLFTSIGEDIPYLVSNSEKEKKKAKISGRGKEQFLAAASKALAAPGDIMYFPMENGLGFLTAINNEQEFHSLKMMFESDFELLELRVYIEQDTLFMNIGDSLIHNFTFGLSDKELVKNSLLNQDYINFILLHKNDSGVHMAEYNPSFTDRHFVVITSFVHNKYSNDVNLRDKFGDHATYETEREGQLSFLKNVLSDSALGRSENVMNFIQEKYDVSNIDIEDKPLMNEILDYVLTKFTVNVKLFGYCVHDKEELMI